MSDLFYLKLKTQKVQSFIFKVPKLKAMLGANSLLGEFFAKDLPELRNGYNIPKIWKDHIKDLNDLPKWETEDKRSEITDDLKVNFDKGVIVSAGGHFETFFNSDEDAKDFIKKVRKKAQEKIPRVRISYFLKKYKDFENTDVTPKVIETYKDFEEKGEIVQLDTDTSEMLIDNPYFYPSTEDGENPQLINGYKNERDSYITKKIKEQGDKFYKGETKDYLNKFLGKYAYNNNVWKMNDFFPKEMKDYKDLSLIPDNNKIAVIAIDGNAMGVRFSDFRKTLNKKSVFEAMVEMEKFWFIQRETFRKALEEAINQLNIPQSYFTKKDEFQYPFQILMLGGDDLLLVTVPELAFDFVEKFSSALQNNYHNLIKTYKMDSLKENNVSISAGIAFVKYSYPFSQAHELAESLLSSAKVKSRVWENDKVRYRNAVDWHIHFSSGILDIDEIRRKNYYLEYGNKKEILTQRPCTIGEAVKIWEKSKEKFEKIPKDTNEDFNNSKGRNKYKRLRNLLRSGEENVKLYGKLLEIDKDLLEYHSLDFGNSDTENTIKLNNALDIIELIDFHQRENNTKQKESTQEVQNENH